MISSIEKKASQGQSCSASQKDMVQVVKFPSIEYTVSHLQASVVQCCIHTESKPATTEAR